MLCQIEIKNYRCFSDLAPATIELSDGLTALVGPNNSGKSSLLRMLYELRNLWGNLTSSQQIFNATNHQRFSIGALFGTEDPTEIFHDGNARPLAIAINLPSEKLGANSVARVLLTCDRDSAITSWSASVTLKNGLVVDSGTPHRSWNGAHFLLNGMMVDCGAASELFRLLAGAMYIPAFRNAINQGAGSYYDLTVGTGFIGFWKSWKTGKTKKSIRAIGAITKDIQHIFEFAKLDISPSEDAQQLILEINDQPYRGYEVGAGILQFIIVLGNAAVRQPEFILIDEPELNLHASLQIDFLTTLASYAKRGVIFSSHSVGLARSTSRRIYSTRRDRDHSIVKILESTADPSEFLGEMSFSSYRELGFSKILLVEGTTDLITIQQFLRMLNKDHKIVMIPVGGDRYVSDAGREALRELKRVTKNISALFDSEKKSQSGEPSASRAKLASICSELEFDVFLTERRAIENYFSDSAVKAVAGGGYSSLQPYQLVQDAAKPWPKTLNWKIARAMDWSDIADTDLGEFLMRL